MIKTLDLSLIAISTLFILVALTNASSKYFNKLSKKRKYYLFVSFFLYKKNLDSNDEYDEKLLQNVAFENFSPYPILKRNIDKYRYFGGIGKRTYDM